ncbi:hypothetical protein [Sphaerisporangium sp. TRM90804]|uniref:hypothetical protein n=1 Tax=Sphaerisporangium sp. TRM90804 TaxID=3031113 RepID=UPI0024472804|nr:hypothetical protein [Sphaerisporangium sp. TRM90804]MDH2424152.1 hypothetical protein [Sphaerisporangium sp. TRM90804]
MRILPLAATAAIAFTVLATGCSTVDKAQACIEANRVLTETAGKITGLVNDPQAMEKELDNAAKKLEETATTAGNTTLNDALQKLADSYKGLNVTSANEAVDAAQKAAEDTAQTVQTVARECT